MKPNCRTRHSWHSFFDFAKLDPDPGLGYIVRSRICEAIMPNAMNPMLNLWGKSIFDTAARSATSGRCSHSVNSSQN